MTEAQREFYAGFKPVEARQPKPPSAPPRAREVPFEQAVQEFLDAWEIKRRAHPAEQDRVQVIRFPGSPFLKITLEGRSVAAFIAAEDGENATLGQYWQGQIYYPNGWHSPAKHARGSVFDDPPDRCMDWHGPRRLR